MNAFNKNNIKTVALLASLAGALVVAGGAFGGRGGATIGLFLGLSMMTATHLRAEGVPLGWLPGLRAALLAVGVGWSVWLGGQVLKVSRGGTPAKLLAGGVSRGPGCLSLQPLGGAEATRPMHIDAMPCSSPG